MSVIQKSTTFTVHLKLDVPRNMINEHVYDFTNTSVDTFVTICNHTS